MNGGIRGAMKKVMERRLVRVEEAIRRRRPSQDTCRAATLLKQKLDQIAARLRSVGIAPEPMSPAEWQAFLVRWRAYVERF